MKRVIYLCLTLLLAVASMPADAQEHSRGDYRHSFSINAGCPSGYLLCRGLFVDVYGLVELNVGSDAIFKAGLGFHF